VPTSKHVSSIRFGPGIKLLDMTSLLNDVYLSSFHHMTDISEHNPVFPTILRRRGGLPQLTYVFSRRGFELDPRPRHDQVRINLLVVSTVALVASTTM